MRLSQLISPVFRAALYSFVAVCMFDAQANENIQQLLFKRFTVDDGLPNNYTEIVFVDSDGMIWVGGQQGLSLFDTYSFTNYTKVRTDSTSLSSNLIAEIFESRSNTLWIGTYNGGLHRFDRSKRCFKRYTDPRYGISTYSVRKVIEDTNGILWLGTYHGIYRFDPVTETAKHYNFGYPHDLSSEKTATARGLYCDKKGTVWAGAGMVRGLFTYNEQRDTFELVPNKALQAILQKAIVRIISEDSKGNIWICTRDCGIVEYSPAQQTVRHYTKENGLIHSNTLMNMYIDEKDNVWIASFNNLGMAVLLKDSKKLIVYRNDKTDPSSIPSNSITSITQDRDGNYWISSHGGGIALFKGIYSGFSHYKACNNDPRSLSDNMVSCFAQDAKGTVWIGTDGGGLNEFDRAHNSFTRYSTANGFKSDVVLSILPVSHNELMLSGWDFGICTLNTESKRIENIALKGKGKYSPLTNDIKSLYRDSKGIIWHGNHSLDGLSYQLPGNKTILRDSSLTDYPFSFRKISYINQIFEDSDNSLWIASRRGLFYYKDSLRLFVHEESDTLSLASNYATIVFEDSKHTIWIGTAEGLQRFDKKTGNFTNYTDKFHLPLFIAGILEDSLGNLWISSTEGLVKFNPRTGAKVLYDSQSGMRGSHYVERSCLKTADGEMYFGSTDGFVRFYPGQIVNHDIKPRILLTDFEVFNKSRFDLLVPDTAAGCSYRIAIPYSWSVFSFEFSVLSYWSSNKNIYSYRLDGFDREWSDASSSHKATYTNLDPGTYIFRVRGANNAGVWNNDGIAVELVILPPFWLTWWFKLLTAAFILALLFMFYYVRINSLNRKKITLENEVKNRTYELKQLNTSLEEQQEEILQQYELLELQKQKLEEYNESILRKTGEVLLQREKISEQNERLEKSNRELDQLVKSKDKFFSIIAHDLKNPINAIMGFSDLLLRRFEKTDNDKKREFIVHINQSANSIYNLLVNLLDWSRTQRHNIKPTPKNYALANIFEDNRLLLADMAHSKGIRLEMYASQDTVVYADINILNTVLRNLISNSVKFTGRNGLITVISHEESDGWVSISVQDTGTGMSKEKLETLFRIDTNMSTDGTEHEKGTGLGLLVVHEFVLANGGTISVSSVLNEGSKFTFTVPSRKPDTFAG